MNNIAFHQTAAAFKHLMLILVCGFICSSALAQRISDFALLDQNGKFHQLSYYKDSAAVVLLLVPDRIDPALQQTFQEFSKQKQFQGIPFFYLTPSKIANREQFSQELLAEGVTQSVLIDSDQLVTTLLGAKNFGEILVLDPKRQGIVYRGQLGDEFHSALLQLSEGKTATPARSSLHGLASIAGNNDTKAISYADDIAPIFIQHCVTCHRDGGVAPFAMDSWGVVLGWSPMIKEVLLTKRMPPGQIDPTIGHFSNSRVLESAQLKKLIRWIDEGGLNDSDKDPLEAYQWNDQEWEFGQPDLVLTLPEQNIPATGLIDYTDLTIPVSIAEDRWVKATQFVPGDRRVLHHAEAVVLNSSIHDLESSSVANGLAAENFLGIYSNASRVDAAIISPYVPGIAPVKMPENTGGKLEKKAQLAIQLHYAAIGREIKDSTRLGIWYYPKNQTPTDRLVVACTCLPQSQWKKIPAYAENFTAEASLILEDNVEIYNLLPQMHYRGSAIRFDAHLPNGEQEALLSIPKYNYNWQIDYQFAEPKYLPKGTRIVATAVYDNSNKNAFNPDASQDVPWGRESYNEILAGIFQWKVVD